MGRGAIAPPLEEAPSAADKSGPPLARAGGGSVYKALRNLQFLAILNYAWRPMIVCSCNVLSDTQILATLQREESQRPRSPVQAYGCLGCAPRCGRCLPTVRALLANARVANCDVGCADLPGRRPFSRRRRGAVAAAYRRGIIPRSISLLSDFVATCPAATAMMWNYSKLRSRRGQCGDVAAHLRSEK